MKIYIVGFMGSGKSTYGERLSKAMKHSFVDLDKLIEERVGKTIAEIFEQEGEEAFRKLETEALHSTAEMQDTVISTGGGTACFNDNMSWMNDNGVTVYLRLFESIIQKRLERAVEERPLLAGMDDDERHTFIHETLTERSMHYSQAQWVIQPEQFGFKKLAEIFKAQA